LAFISLLNHAFSPTGLIDTPTHNSILEGPIAEKCYVHIGTSLKIQATLPGYKTFEKLCAL